jgi:hypothetical protein
MRLTLIKLSVAAVIATALALGPQLLSPQAAYAEDDECNPDSAQTGKFVIEERNGQKVYVIKDEITVCGKVPRPSVVYVLQAKQINYKWETLKQDFLPKILNSVKKAPF